MNYLKVIFKGTSLAHHVQFNSIKFDFIIQHELLIEFKDLQYLFKLDNLEKFKLGNIIM